MEKLTRSEYEINQELTDALIWFINEVAETVQYGSWTDEFCRVHVNKSIGTLLEWAKKYIDWDNLTVSKALALGFRCWENDLYLIPLWLLPIVPMGTKLTDIFGEEFIYDGSNADKDIRFGCIAYGIRINDEESEEGGTT